MSSIIHDFRSDTVTRPTAAMREAMAAAPVGDDVYGDDPSVNALEAALAARLGKQAAVLLPSGTMSNLVGLMSHCGRGDEYIAGQEAHCYLNEAGGGAVLGSIQPQPLDNEADGSIALSAIEAAIKPDNPHYARTRLLALENTIGGRVLPMDYMRDATDLARRHGLGTQLDGARLFNASVASGTDAADIAALFDTVSVCLSKGLGAPVGSVLVGAEEMIARARRHRKILGGGMRQAGVLAAAGLYALENHVERLAEDHANAAALAAGLARHEALTVTEPQTNIVFVAIDAAHADGLSEHLAANGIGITRRYGGTAQRWVTHLDVDAAAVAAALKVVDGYFSAAAPR